MEREKGWKRKKKEKVKDHVMVEPTWKRGKYFGKSSSTEK